MTAPRALAARPRNGPVATTASRRRVVRGLARLAVVLIAAGCLVPTALSAAAATSEVVDTPLGFEDARCAVPVPESRLGDVQCGYLTVPERRAADADPARKIRLPVAVIRSRSAERVTDPLVVPTAGTADGSSIGALAYFLARPAWVGERDVVLVEQRGGIHAEPSLDCVELDGVPEPSQRLARLRECHDRLLGEGIDPAAYSSAASAADLGDLHLALGYDTWNLYGAGEASRLALAVMRDHPAGLRSVILDGPQPLDVDLSAVLPTGVEAALDALVADCRSDPACRARYPDLAASLAAAIERADREPLTVVVDDDALRSSVAVTSDGAGVVDALVSALQDPRTAPAVPYVIDRLAHGDADAALPLVQRRVDAAGLPAEGLGLSIACSEEVPFHDPAALELAQSSSPVAAHVTDAASTAA
ncbi:MAG: hypothetical protein ABWY03_10140, partial [Microbacterium sp.]